VYVCLSVLEELMRLLLCLSILGLLWAPALAAQQDYNGRWAINLTTERGQCVPDFRLNIRIRRGKAYIVGRSLSGRKAAVSSSGRVNIRYIDGADVITVSGRLNKRTGAGRWQYPTYRCTGYWRAKRR
jgi:hypothetical protein